MTKNKSNIVKRRDTSTRKFRTKTPQPQRKRRNSKKTEGCPTTRTVTRPVEEDQEEAKTVKGFNIKLISPRESVETQRTSNMAGDATNRARNATRPYDSDEEVESEFRANNLRKPKLNISAQPMKIDPSPFKQHKLKAEDKGCSYKLSKINFKEVQESANSNIQTKAETEDMIDIEKEIVKNFRERRKFYQKA
jgi:hypothetical protein